ncbi:sugar isomerase domain-containing protein [Occultella glacieicola]|uniref:Sugar isomerase domain-containing protein n=1 Tax=Occultella glacieicola TaxID=2518684 RepID=A0ABY2DZU2_9MICO|nr:SIS domain-containing protein [Occultella glacieicola]TDE90414.1 sugar isomerase domain-containing protein [Occultella glacieicola]
MIAAAPDLLAESTDRLERLAAAAEAGAYDPAIDLMVTALDAGGVIQAFGTGHSQAFAMEMAGRAGGLIPTNGIALRDVVLFGGREPAALYGSELERDETVVAELLRVTRIGEPDVFVIASNSGVNSSVVGLAQAVKGRGHKVIAVTSLEHTNSVEPQHPSGLRLAEIADVVIDNLAPRGDTTLTVADGVGVGAVSSITGAFIAQLLTIGVAQRLADAGGMPPVYLSANVPGGDEHNQALQHLYRGRIRWSV